MMKQVLTNRIFLVLCAGFLSMAGGSYSLMAQPAEGRSQGRECREFVQQFYVWYVRAASSETKEPAWRHALKSKPYAFSRELTKRLRDNSATPAGEYLLELDFDPILNTQEPNNPRIVGGAKRKADGCWVEIYGFIDGKKSVRPLVTPELILKDGRWVFVNFHYPEGGDLLSTLKQNRDEQLKSESGQHRQKPK
jgi:hypothetical protein